MDARRYFASREFGDTGSGGGNHAATFARGVSRRSAPLVITSMACCHPGGTLLRSCHCQTTWRETLNALAASTWEPKC